MIMIKSHHNLHKLVSEESKAMKKVSQVCLRSEQSVRFQSFAKFEITSSVDPSLCVIWLVKFRIYEITIFRT